MKQKSSVGRLAFIPEGDFMNVYYLMPPGSTPPGDDGALIGSLALAFTKDEEIYRRFKNLCKDAVQRLLEEDGMDCEWGEEQTARKPLPV